MIRKISILYAWLVRTIFFFFPDIPIIMKIRGRCYSLAMAACGRNFQVTHSAILNSISELSVGDNVYLANNAHLLCGGGIFIHNDVLVGPGVVISSDNHGFDRNNGYRFMPPVFGKVSIGRGSWLCANSVITKDSNFPPFAVLGPCSVFSAHVKKALESDRVEREIYAGNPAELVRRGSRND